MRKLAIAIEAGIGLVAAGIGTGWTQSPAAKPPIKVGVMYLFKGPFAVLGELQLVGMKLAFDQRYATTASACLLQTTTVRKVASSRFSPDGVV